MARVVVVTQDPREGGGVLRMLEALIRVLRDDGHTVELASIATSRSDPNSTRIGAPTTWVHHPRATRSQFDSSVGPVEWIHHGGRFAELGWVRYRPRQSIDDQLAGADVIVVCAGSAQFGGVVRSHPKSALLVIVATTIADERRQTAHSRRRRILLESWNITDRRAEMRTLRAADELLALSPRTVRLIHDLVDRHVLLAPLGYEKAAQSSRAEGEPRSHFLTVARADDPRKRLDVLFEAIRMATERQPMPPLFLVSQNPLPKSLRPAADDLQAAGSLVVEIDIHRDMLERRYRSALALVHTADQEGLGLTVFEAFAHATPVIITRCGAPEDIVRHGVDGFLVERRDARGIAENMIRLTNDPGLARQLGVSGFESLKTRWDPEIGRGELRDAIRRCASRSRGKDDSDDD